jgi:hypothetical protein
VTNLAEILSFLPYQTPSQLAVIEAAKLIEFYQQFAQKCDSRYHDLVFSMMFVLGTNVQFKVLNFLRFFFTAVLNKSNTGLVVFHRDRLCFGQSLFIIVSRVSFINSFHCFILSFEFGYSRTPWATTHSGSPPDRAQAPCHRIL